MIVMSDKRYYYNIFDDGTEYIEDYWENKHYFNLNDVEELLNEQQTIIKSKDKQLERLYNYFKAYLEDEMSSNAFSEMWDFVKEDEIWENEGLRERSLQNEI